VEHGRSRPELKLKSGEYIPMPKEYYRGGGGGISQEKKTKRKFKVKRRKKIGKTQTPNYKLKRRV